MNIQTDAVDAPDDETPPGADEETPPGQEEPKPSAAEPTERERELERRLTEQGRHIATLRQTNNALLTEARDLKATVTEIAANQSEQAKEAQARREAERKAYLESLPPERRTSEEVRLLREEIGELKRTRTDAPRARTADAAPAQRTETDEQYAARRAREIVVEANTEFDVQLTPAEISALPEGAWASEDHFYREVNKLAARKAAQGGTEMPKKDPPKPETPAEMEERITRSVKASLGVDSPASPRGTAARGKKPTEADVAATVNSYNSAAGPKANIKKLKELRDRMG